VKSLAQPADVSRKSDVDRLVDAAMREFGRIDILVNNAMKIVPGKLEELSEAAWDTTMNIGLRGAFLMSQAAARHMIERKSGCIVNIASIAGLFPYNWAGSYSVVKAGLIMVTKLPAVEWAPYGIQGFIFMSPNRFTAGSVGERSSRGSAPALTHSCSHCSLAKGAFASIIVAQATRDSAPNLV
jgi:NAD(P)-dependent dehydrogenase (short-subunit alcohol dehydrogenase family)